MPLIEHCQKRSFAFGFSADAVFQSQEGLFDQVMQQQCSLDRECHEDRKEECEAWFRRAVVPGQRLGERDQWKVYEVEAVRNSCKKEQELSNAQ